ncbi:hypothetical protein [Pseudarthrobacter phenanthrenivorans]|uniref:hypothetical protein n=1 Tax=Pseudarthrobacter phenanthrenivorans TaxID=361575 RepID=UPI002F34F381
MTQTASSPLGTQLTVSLPAAGAGAAAQDAVLQDSVLSDPVLPAEGFAAAASLTGPLAAGPLAPELEPHLAVAAAAAEEDVLSVVWRASSLLESMQWELDNAQESLRQAVRKASASGIAHAELCAAANLSPEELATVLMAAQGGTEAIQL